MEAWLKWYSPCIEVWSPEFKSQYCQNKKTLQKHVCSDLVPPTKLHLYSSSHLPIIHSIMNPSVD
jgi:hypothetical protein